MDISSNQPLVEKLDAHIRYKQVKNEEITKIDMLYSKRLTHIGFIVHKLLFIIKFY
jgi:hypothetical protein